MTVSFVHLRLHTEFSLVDGLVRVKPLAKAVAGLGMPAVAVTDQSNMCSLVKFYKTAMGAGIKPICGADIWLASREEDGPLSRLSLLAMNAKGYRNLTELISRGWSEGQRNGEIIIERDWVKEAAEGLIALSAAKEGEIGHALLDGEEAKAEALLREWMEVFPERFYVEVQRTSRVNDEEHLHAAVALASRCNAPLVATNDVRFIKQDDFEAHETRVCIGEGRTLDDPRRPRTYSDQQYLKSPAEMAELFSDLPEALETPSRSPSSATSRCSWASTSCRTSPRPMAWASTTTCGTPPSKVSRSAWRCCCRRTPRTTRPSARSMSIA